MTKFRGDKYYLSNMFPCVLKINGNTFKCVEAAFQSFKTTDPNTRRLFSMMSGFQAKRFGRTVKLRPDWEDIKVEVMRRILKIKFQGELGNKLASEEDDTLIEEND